MELPSHPDADDSPSDQELEPTTSTNWRTLLVFGVLAALLAVIVILHLVGVIGPAAH